MNNTKYLAEISIVGLVLILALIISVSAMPYISIGNTTQNFTVVPGQDADITVPIMVKNINVSNASETIKGLQFNVTFNCSMINITNITKVDVVNIPTALSKTEIYNKLCNNSPMPTGTGLQKVFCVYMNTSLTPNNKTNASILFATVKDLGNNNCVLRIAFASYTKLTGDVEIGKIKIHVKGMQNYFTTNVVLPINITIEKMGLNKSVNIINDSSQYQTDLKINGLIKACRGDAVKDNTIDGSDAKAIRLYTLYKMGITNAQNYPGFEDLKNMKDCFDVTGDGEIDGSDAKAIRLYTLYKMGITNAQNYPGFKDLANYTVE
ncbi:MAG: hypothetical protein QMD06_00855 [Candidatus Altarchaeum sp.]|nr:hypothetical protein [Candidatus Altarchaeum sp.]